MKSSMINTTLLLTRSFFMFFNKSCSTFLTLLSSLPSSFRRVVIGSTTMVSIFLFVCFKVVDFSVSGVVNDVSEIDWSLDIVFHTCVRIKQCSYKVWFTCSIVYHLRKWLWCMICRFSDLRILKFCRVFLWLIVWVVNNFKTFKYIDCIIHTGSLLHIWFC